MKGGSSPRSGGNVVVVTAGFPPGSGLVPVVGASVPGSGSVVVVAVLEGDRVVVVVVVGVPVVVVVIVLVLLVGSGAVTVTSVESNAIELPSGRPDETKRIRDLVAGRHGPGEAPGGPTAAFFLPIRRARRQNWAAR